MFKNWVYYYRLLTSDVYKNHIISFDHKDYERSDLKNPGFMSYVFSRYLNDPVDNTILFENYNLERVKKGLEIYRELKKLNLIEICLSGSNEITNHLVSIGGGSVEHPLKSDDVKWTSFNDKLQDPTYIGFEDCVGYITSDKESYLVYGSKFHLLKEPGVFALKTILQKIQDIQPEELFIIWFLFAYDDESIISLLNTKFFLSLPEFFEEQFGSIVLYKLDMLVEQVKLMMPLMSEKSFEMLNYHAAKSIFLAENKDE